MGFVGDDAADAAAGGGVVAGTAGDEVEMAMEDGLTGGFAVVGAEVEAGDGGVGGLEIGGQFFREAMGGGPFAGGEIAERGDVAPGDDEGVAGADGEAVAKGEAGAVCGDHSVGGQGTERARGVHADRIKPGPGRGKRIDSEA